ncbi:hypothetical protein EV702DRAFT_1047981 [Suillus placidus]|uniref:Uncharacterized protein n=1 Tax=Suillus placidus TaxID=48579 RepID=A0A9P6ZP72_9AGAM|nr:hypothetical protein EV702DRAFT_1047981 [Suillus placidus]
MYYTWATIYTSTPLVVHIAILLVHLQRPNRGLQVVRSIAAMITIILFTPTANHPAFKRSILLIAYWADLPVTIDWKLWTARQMMPFQGIWMGLAPYLAAMLFITRKQFVNANEMNRLHTLLTSLYAETHTEFCRAEEDAQALLKTLVTKQSLTRIVDDAQYLDAVCQRNKTSLRETDTQLDLIKDRIMQRLPVNIRKSA